MVSLYHGTLCTKMGDFIFQNSLDAGIQDVSTSISIEFKIEYLNELIEMSVDDESDTHVEARDRRYSCLILILLKVVSSLILPFCKAVNEQTVVV